MLSMQFAAVGFYDSSDAIQTKTIMALTDFPKRLTPPVSGGQVKTSLWFMEREAESVFVDSRSRKKLAFATIVPEGVGEKLGKCFFEKLRINIQRPIAGLNVPRNLGAFFWEIVSDFRAQILHKVSGLVRD
jgi:hypothetical protein